MDNEITLAREYRAYRKMYYHLFAAITNALESDNKSTSDYYLRKATMETEDIFIGECIETSDLTCEEEIIKDLLGVIINTIENCVPEEKRDYELVETCNEWIEELDNKKVLMEEFNKQMEEWKLQGREEFLKVEQCFVE